MAGAPVTAKNQAKNQPDTVTDKEGNFEMSLPAGIPHCIQVKLDEGRIQGAVLVSAPRDQVVSTTVTVLRAVPVRVQVVDSQDQPLPDTVIAIAGSETNDPGYGSGFGSGYCQGATEANGAVEVLIPQTWTHLQVVGISQGHGLEFLKVTRVANEKEVDLSGSPLKMSGAKPLQFRVTDWSDQPIAGADVRLSTIGHGPGRDSLNMHSIVTELGNSTTDENGFVRFDWYPQWASSFSATVGNKSGEFCSGYFGSNFPAEADGTYWIRLSRLVYVRGKVVRSDGSHASQVEVRVTVPRFDAIAVAIPEGLDSRRERQRLMNIQSGHFQDAVKMSATTDENGEYELRLPPSPKYSFLARETGWASRVQTDIACWEGLPSDDVNLTLHPTKKITGRVTIGGVPRGNADLHFGLLLKPGNKAAPPRHFAHTYRFKTDNDGRYEVEVGPGYYMTAVALFTKTKGSTPFFEIDEAGGEIIMDFQQ